MCGDDAMMLIASRGMPLDSSLSAPSAQQKHVVRRAGLHERRDEAVREREHRDEHRDHEPDAERGERGRHGTLRHAAQVVDERDLHSTLRSACTTGSFAACHAGNDAARHREQQRDRRRPDERVPA